MSVKLSGCEYKVLETSSARRSNVRSRKNWGENPSERSRQARGFPGGTEEGTGKNKKAQATLRVIDVLKFHRTRSRSIRKGDQELDQVPRQGGIDRGDQTYRR